MDCCCKLTDKVARHILVYLIVGGFQIVLSFVVEFRKIFIVSCVSKPSSLSLSVTVFVGYDIRVLQEGSLQYH